MHFVSCHSHARKDLLRCSQPLCVTCTRSLHHIRSESWTRRREESERKPGASADSSTMNDRVFRWALNQWKHLHTNRYTVHPSNFRLTWCFYRVRINSRATCSKSGMAKLLSPSSNSSLIFLMRIVMRWWWLFHSHFVPKWPRTFLLRYTLLLPCTFLLLSYSERT